MAKKLIKTIKINIKREMYLFDKRIDSKHKAIFINIINYVSFGSIIKNSTTNHF